ncbi:MAG: response regulator [Leptolyngbyaceae cyanobacterium bins.349]|nr:response regulator [Leptolyngbyaceae cyanobacterium bins.349]
MNILLVEDDEVDVMNIRRAFRRNQIQNPIYTASDGLEALALLRGTGDRSIMPPTRRIVLLDLNMPRMSGLEFLQELRSDAQLRTIPVIVLTTSNREQDRQQAYHYNVAGYLVKPIAFDAFSDLMVAFNHYWILNEIP